MSFSCMLHARVTQSVFKCGGRLMYIIVWFKLWPSKRNKRHEKKNLSGQLQPSSLVTKSSLPSHFIFLFEASIQVKHWDYAYIKRFNMEDDDMSICSVELYSGPSATIFAIPRRKEESLYERFCPSWSRASLSSSNQMEEELLFLHMHIHALFNINSLLVQALSHCQVPPWIMMKLKTKCIFHAKATRLGFKFLAQVYSLKLWKVVFDRVPKSRHSAVIERKRMWQWIKPIILIHHCVI